MKPNQIIKKLEKFRQKDDFDGALAFIEELPDEDLPLHAVIVSGWVDLIPKLDYMRLCEDFDTPWANGLLPLHLATLKGPQMLRTVILQSIESGLYDFDDDEHTPAMIAAAAGDIESLRILARAGADFDQVSDVFGNTALESACRSGKLEVVQYLLDAGADPTLADMEELNNGSYSQTALDMIKEAAELRNNVDYQRFKTIQVSMGAGEADFIMPAKLAQTSDLFIADVIGDLHSDTEKVRLEHGERAFGDAPNAVNAAAFLGMNDVAQRIARKREIKQAELAPAPKGQKPH